MKFFLFFWYFVPDIFLSTISLFIFQELYQKAFACYTLHSLFCYIHLFFWCFHGSCYNETLNVYTCHTVFQRVSVTHVWVTNTLWKTVYNAYFFSYVGIHMVFRGTPHHIYLLIHTVKVFSFSQCIFTHVLSVLSSWVYYFFISYFIILQNIIIFLSSLVLQLFTPLVIFFSMIILLSFVQGSSTFVHSYQKKENSYTPINVMYILVNVIHTPVNVMYILVISQCYSHPSMLFTQQSMLFTQQSILFSQQSMFHTPVKVLWIFAYQSMITNFLLSIFYNQRLSCTLSIIFIASFCLVFIPAASSAEITYMGLYIDISYVFFFSHIFCLFTLFTRMLSVF